MGLVAGFKVKPCLSDCGCILRTAQCVVWRWWPRVMYMYCHGGGYDVFNELICLPSASNLSTLLAMRGWTLARTWTWNLTVI